MILISLTALFMGTCTGWALARRYLLRTLVGLVVALMAVFFLAGWIPSENLPGDDFLLTIVAYLFVPPMTAGLIGGAVFAWLLRPRSEKS